MDALAKLFGNPARVRMIRLFLLNPECVFTPAMIKERSKVTSLVCASEVSRFKSAGLIKHKSFFQNMKTHGANGKPRRKRVQGLQLNTDFIHIEPLKSLLLDAQSFNKKAIADRFRVVGKVKLLIISGIFIHNDQSRVDVLVVGDSLRKNLVHSIIKTLESETGSELRYATFKTDDFIYRIGIFDKFIRDILDYPHEKLVNKLNV